MLLDMWAARWGVPRQALDELRRCFGAANTDPAPMAGKSEAAVQTQIRLEASKKGARLWRNNVGACTDERGNFIRYGLANDSQAMNRTIKSSDLIGLRPVVITPAHVGKTLGQFVAREVKAPGWQYRSGDKRAAAQLAFLQLVASMGGDAAFADREGTL